MASKEHKIVRRAQALTELSRLSGLLAEHLSVEVPDMQVTNRDSELAEIQRIENVNALLSHVLQASGGSGSFSTMTKAQLLDKAAESGVEISKSATKAEIIEALEKDLETRVVTDGPK
jgi:hypothetical protein